MEFINLKNNSNMAESSITNTRPSIFTMRIKLIPWWFLFIISIYILLKTLFIVESPCSLLGITSPITKTNLLKSYRTLSLCTHPDKLISKNYNSIILNNWGNFFSKITASKDRMVEKLRESKLKYISCDIGFELELSIIYSLYDSLHLINIESIFDTLYYIRDFFYTLITFQNGFLETLLTFFLLSVIFGIFKNLSSYMYSTGPIGLIIGILHSFLIAPIPTIFSFIISPFIRWYVFITDELLPMFGINIIKIKESDSLEDKDDNEEKKDDTIELTKEYIDRVNAIKANSVIESKAPTHFKNRKSAKAKADLEKEKQDALLGKINNNSADIKAEEDVNATTLFHEESNLYDSILQKSDNPGKMRAIAAAAIQFDFLLSLTKHIIPTFSLIATGQFLDGIMPSMIISQILKNGIPNLSSSTLHLFAVLFGAVHTILGINGAGRSNNDPNAVLVLQWNVSFKDALAIANLCLIGATYTAAAGMGNELSFAMSFAAGLALRMFVLDLMTTYEVTFFDGLLKDLNVSFGALNDISVRAVPGIGDCGGGPFRMLFGNGSYAEISSLIIKIFIMLLPALYVCQCAVRTYKSLNPEDNTLNRRAKNKAALMNAFLLFCGLIQFRMLYSFNLNAVNGTMAHFWILVLCGGLFESLLSSYDIRGGVRQVLQWILFIFL